MQNIDLAGPWTTALDPGDRGIAESWWAQDIPGTETLLPGTLDNQGVGTATDGFEMGRLTRTVRYVGPAWRQRTITVPVDWVGKHVELSLERVLWETRVWLDDAYVGTADSLVAPQRFDLTPYIRPGRQRLTLRINNEILINIGHTYGGHMWTHAVTEETQTNWNGAIGEIAITVREPVHIAGVRVDYEPAEDRAALSVRVRNTGRDARTVRVEARARGGMERLRAGLEGVSVPPGESIHRLHLPLQGKAQLWSEFSPALYDLYLSLYHDGDELDAHETTFGLRTIGTDGRRLLLNGQPVFLRGNVDAAVFPRTGHPPMDVESWTRFFQVHRDYGFNFVRFHSWCPPRAAFVAADQMGFYIQPEAPLWDGYGEVGLLADRANFINNETRRIIEEYGNHPSFIMMSMGNELGDGNDPYLASLVHWLRRIDGRRLYTTTTHPSDKARDDDYFTSAADEAGGLRGWQRHGPDNAATDWDFDEMARVLDKPVMAHEVGQSTMLPALDTVDKYTGNLRARYLDVFRERFAAHHPPDRYDVFRNSSQKLAAVLYKAEMEAMLRTGEYAGYQILGLQDFPGQGVAIVGMLDPFLDSKGAVTPAEYRRHNAPVTVLARMPQRTWSPGDVLEVALEVRNNGAGDIAGSEWSWTLRSDKGEIAAGTIGPVDIPVGGITPIAAVRAEIPPDLGPRELVLAVDGAASNEWSVWIVEDGPREWPAGVMVAKSWDDDVARHLAGGGAVIISHGDTTLLHGSPTRFAPVYWSKQLFPNQSAGMGIHAEEGHPALDGFPTRHHADFQWINLLDGASALDMTDVPGELDVIVWQIDDMNESRRLCLIGEARVGPGRLLVVGASLGTDGERTSAQGAMVRSLASHILGDGFAPSARLTPAQAAELLAPYPTAVGTTDRPDLSRAAHHVISAANAPMYRGSPALPEYDELVRSTPGYGISHSGGAWRNDEGPAWHGIQIEIVATVPPGTEGELVVWLHDTNSQGRVARIFFEGRDLGPVADYSGPGAWLRLPYTEEQSAGGTVRMQAHTERGPNVMVREAAIIPTG